MIISAGYFAQQGQWIFIVMFVVLLILALASAFAVARQVIERRRDGSA